MTAARAAILVLLVLGLDAAAAAGQADTTRAAPEVRPSEPIPLEYGLAPADTVPVLARRFREAQGAEALAAVPSEDILPRNPRNAALRSFLVPGWGQLYTGHPFRAILFASAEIGFGLAGWRWQRKTIDKRAEIRTAREEFFADTLQTLPEDPELREQAFRQTAQGARLFSELASIRDRREDFYAWAIASVIFSAIDAYVAAHLDPLDLHVDPRARRVGADVRIPLGRR